MPQHGEASATDGPSCLGERTRGFLIWNLVSPREVPTRRQIAGHQTSQISPTAQNLHRGILCEVETSGMQ